MKELDSIARERREAYQVKPFSRESLLTAWISENKMLLRDDHTTVEGKRICRKNIADSEQELSDIYSAQFATKLSDKQREEEMRENS